MISFSGFEAWWKDRAGIQEPDIPVLPEYMVMRIAEKVRRRFPLQIRKKKRPTCCDVSSENSDVVARAGEIAAWLEQD